MTQLSSLLCQGFSFLVTPPGIFPLLNRGVQSSIEILELIAEKPLTFEEIAEEMEMNHNTISQKLNALIDGGYSGLTLTESTAFAQIGRCRKLARQNKKDLVEEFKQFLAKIDE